MYGQMISLVVYIKLQKVYDEQKFKSTKLKVKQHLAMNLRHFIGFVCVFDNIHERILYNELVKHRYWIKNLVFFYLEETFQA